MEYIFMKLKTYGDKMCIWLLETIYKTSIKLRNVLSEKGRLKSKFRKSKWRSNMADENAKSCLIRVELGTRGFLGSLITNLKSNSKIQIIRSNVADDFSPLYWIRHF